MDAHRTRPLLGHARERRLRALDVLNAMTVVASQHLSQPLAANDTMLVVSRLADAFVTVPVAIRNVLKLWLEETARTLMDIRYDTLQESMNGKNVIVTRKQYVW